VRARVSAAGLRDSCRAARMKASYSSCPPWCPPKGRSLALAAVARAPCPAPGLGPELPERLPMAASTLSLRIRCSARSSHESSHSIGSSTAFGTAASSSAGEGGACAAARLCSPAFTPALVLPEQHQLAAPRRRRQVPGVPTSLDLQQIARSSRGSAKTCAGINPTTAPSLPCR
jgi:hypothetical protein